MWISTSTRYGDNILTPSENMSWWTGTTVKTSYSRQIVKIVTVKDALQFYFERPPDPPPGPFSMSVSRAYKIPGSGYILCGRVDQGIIKEGDQIGIYLGLDHSIYKPSKAIVYHIESFRNNTDQATTGDLVGLCLRNSSVSLNFAIANSSRMVISQQYFYDSTFQLKQNFFPVKRFTALVDIHYHTKIKRGFSAIGYCRTQKSMMKVVDIVWKMNKSDTKQEKIPNPEFVKFGELASIVFEPNKCIILDKFKSNPVLGRVLIFNTQLLIMVCRVDEIVSY